MNKARLKKLVSLNLDIYLKDETCLHYIASNINTPIDLLKELSTHPSDKIRNTVSENKSIFAEICLILSKDKNTVVRRKASLNLKMPIEGLIKLSKDEDNFVRRWVAIHPNTPIDFLLKLTEDEDEGVRYAAKQYRIDRLMLLI